jgi:metal-dependent amidase/aminoacylase/carboxypeptidase family protein
MRCFSETSREIIETRMKTLADAAAAATGCAAEVTLRWGTRVLVNHGEQTDVAIAAANDLVGAENVAPDAPPITGGEDFSFMLEQRPGAFMFIGNGVAESGTTHAVHTPLYDFNDEIIPLGVEYWVSLVRKELALAG